MTNKEAYQEKINAQLKQWQAELAKLKAQADEAKADAKIEYNRQIEDLATKRKNVEQKLQQLNKAGGESWRELKAGLDEAVDALQQSFKRAKDKLHQLTA